MTVRMGEVDDQGEKESDGVGKGEGKVRVKVTVKAMRDSVVQGFEQKQKSKKHTNNKIIISHCARRI